MQEDSAKLEEGSRMLDPPDETATMWMEMMVDYARNFLQKMDSIPVYCEEGDKTNNLDRLNVSEEPRSLEILLKHLYKSVDTVGINPADARHMGYVPGGALISGAMGDFLAAITNRYAGIYYANPGAAKIEYLMVKWLASLVEYPDEAVGNLSSGGSMATLTAITTARDHHNISPEKIRTSVVYVTRQAHHCILKALKIAGLGAVILRTVGMKSDYTMDVSSLKVLLDNDINNQLNPFLIAASAGSTDLGIIDPLDEIAEVAKQYRCWFHVDAAYGGFFLLVEKARKLFKGISQSDSVVMDPHKGLFLPYGTGAVIIKNRSAVMYSHAYRANYMQDSYQEDDPYSPADFSPELTRHFRGLRMWLSLHLFGLKPFRSALEEKLVLTKYFYREVSELGFITGPEPTLSVCLFRLDHPDQTIANQMNRKLTQYLQQGGQIFLSTTTIGDVFWLRICILVFRTHREHVDLLLRLLKDYRD